jgi:hypothetical protein
MNWMGVSTNFTPTRWSKARILGLTAWAFLPLVAVAYHYGPGQTALREDRAAAAISTAETAVAAENWKAAVDAYDEALGALPAERKDEALRLRLEKSKAQMLSAGLPQAHEELKTLLSELTELGEKATPGQSQLRNETRAALGNSHYYMTWLMRLEGQPREIWEPEVEAARQHFTLLESAEVSVDQKVRYQKDLAASVRLARMDLTELQGLPIPSQ